MEYQIYPDGAVIIPTTASGALYEKFAESAITNQGVIIDNNLNNFRVKFCAIFHRYLGSFYVSLIL
jgi:hypothetical protein